MITCTALSKQAILANGFDILCIKMPILTAIVLTSSF